MQRISTKYLVPFLALILITFLCGQAVMAADQTSKDQEKTAAEKYLAKGKNTGKYFPTDDWRTCKPEEAGMDSAKLIKAFEYAATPEFNTRAVVVIKDGYIVGEAYYGRVKKKSRHTSHSVAKSFTSALIGIAIGQGLIDSVDAKVCQFYDEWDCDDQGDIRRDITLKHLMTVTSGLDWLENWSPGYKGRNDTLEMGQKENYLDYMLDREGLHKPGTKFTYSTGDPMLLSGVIKKATGFTPFEYARKNLFNKIGAPRIRWGHDRAGNTITAWGIMATARDYAKFGYLFLNKGLWDGEQIVPREWVETSTRAQSDVQGWAAYGLLWHVNLPLRLRAYGSNIPADGYMAEGTGGQNIFIIPSKNLVVVKTANDFAYKLKPVEFLELIIGSIKE
jgi:CubicO group peptidase (beta-lactamase class C family)